MKEGIIVQFEKSYEHLIEKLAGWMDTIIIYLPNFIIAIVVFILAYFLSRLVKKYLNKFLIGRITEQSVRSLVTTTASILVVLGGLVLAIGVMNLSTVLKSMLAGAGVAGLAIGLALQSSLSNTFSGIYLSLKSYINVGDWVETNGYAGTVAEVNLRNTVIREPDNNLVMIPNRMMVENPLKNYGLTDQIRIIVECGVAYGSDLEQVEKLTKQAIQENFDDDESKEIEFHYLEFGDSSINFQTRFWIDAKVNTTILESRSKAIKVIKKTFDDNGINIPFPIRTIYKAN
ncbi:mechanosensitive ion channel family protein [bacterium]|nr:mechanosensitive ion channel family protein [bacterium]